MTSSPVSSLSWSLSSLTITDPNGSDLDCPQCQAQYNKTNHLRLRDVNCGHFRCQSCMAISEDDCPVCSAEEETVVDSIIREADAYKAKRIKLFQNLKLASIDKKDGKNRTFLHNFIRTYPNPKEFHTLVQFLVANGAAQAFNIQGGDKNATPLQIAVDYCAPLEKTLELLYTAGVNFNAPDQNGDLVLVYATIANQNQKFLTTLINRCGANPQQLNFDNWNVLHHAAYYGSLTALAYFLERGGLDLDINERTGEDRHTPLHKALVPYPNEKDQDETVRACQLLLEKGADLHARCKGGSTPWTMVAKLYSGAKQQELLKLFPKY